MSRVTTEGDGNVVVTTPSGQNAIELIDITKRFPGIIANDQISFNVRQGEVHALLGENGAGKSTLMKILFGIYRPDEGEIRIRGHHVVLQSPADAIQHGIGMVHQELMLIPELTVLENIVLAGETLSAVSDVFIDKKAVRQRIQELSETYGLAVHPDEPVKNLSIGERQRAEILKVLYRDPTIIVFDEPTSSIGPLDKVKMLRLIRAMANSGRAVLPFITHKLLEVVEICDRVTVLRNGRVQGVYRRGEFTTDVLTTAMFGKEIASAVRRSQRPPANDEILSVKDLVLRDKAGRRILNGVAFAVHRGEMLGIAGVSGNGQQELGEVVIGLRTPQKGAIRFKGNDVTDSTPWQMLASGYACVFEDRDVNLVGDLSLRDNIALALHLGKDFTKLGVLLDYEKLAELSRKIVAQYAIKCRDVGAPVQSLSGGNKQKLVLGRILARNSDLIWAHNPTKGLDVASCRAIYDVLLEEKQRGKAVVLISEDLDELIDLCDRIAVMYEGRITGIRPADQAMREELGRLIMGEMTKIGAPESFPTLGGVTRDEP